MKQVFIMLLVIASIVPLYEAATIGEEFIVNNAQVGSRGILFQNYDIRMVAAYKNDIDYRFVYELKRSFFGKEIKQFLMVEMSQEGDIKKVFQARNSKSEQIL